MKWWFNKIKKRCLYHEPIIKTSGCPWPKATMKSPVGACNLRPLFFIFSYFLLFIFYCPGRPALPCPYSAPSHALPLPYPAPTLPCPALALPLPCFEFSFYCQGQEEEVIQGMGSVFFFLLLPGTRGGSYTGNSSSFSSPMGGSAPLDSVTVGGGVRFDGSLVAGMDETSVRLDGWRFERAGGVRVASFTSPKIHWGGIRGCFTKSLHM
jgi:hypothetical protein